MEALSRPCLNCDDPARDGQPLCTRCLKNHTSISKDTDDPTGALILKLLRTVRKRDRKRLVQKHAKTLFNEDVEVFRIKRDRQ
jgi:hypothetical protein